MKLEMGESLVYSWLRHVKDCRVVQTNWKPSPMWESDEDAAEAEALMGKIAAFFRDKYEYEIFKKNSFEQLLKQAECDAVGVAFPEGGMKCYAVEVAFHTKGLNYGSKQDTTVKVLEKLARAALCLRVFFRAKQGEIVFASPKVMPAVLEMVLPAIEDLKRLFSDCGIGYDVRLTANADFCVNIAQPVMMAADEVSDTSELFMRSHQLAAMLGDQLSATKQEKEKAERAGNWAELAVGKLARFVLRSCLEDGKADTKEIEAMQTTEYSKNTFGLSFPLLRRTPDDSTPSRYYAQTLTVRDEEYYLCSQWYENKCRAKLETWLNAHA